MNFLNRCNGYRAERNPASTAGLDTFNEIVDDCRNEFKTLVPESDFGCNGKYECGPRFHDNDAVRNRIYSVATDSEFLARPRSWVLDALRDCASSDHWYKYEKEW